MSVDTNGSPGEPAGVPALDSIPGGNRFGSQLRAARERRKIGVRELSRQIEVSASMISQIELGRVMPSVRTLYAMTTVLGLSFDDLFSNERSSHSGTDTAPSDPRPDEAVARGGGQPALVQRSGSRKTMTLASGVRWEMLTSAPDPEVEFQESIYEVDGESAPAEGLMRHGGHEYGLVLRGLLGITVGWETYELSPGDSISFDSSTPHRLFNLASIPTVAVWVVVGRRGDRRLTAE
jgi:transcriptional regulator with XRE-family HTH domain